MPKRQRLKKSDYRFSPQAGQNGKSSSISASHDVHIPDDVVCSSDSGDVESNRTDFSLTTGTIDDSALNSHAASNTMASCSAISYRTQYARTNKFTMVEWNPL